MATIIGPARARGPLLMRVVASANLSGHRVVTPNDAGEIEYADPLGDSNRPVWLTLGAVMSGAPTDVLTFGEHEEGSWAWNPDLPIWLGLNGTLTQTLPTYPTSGFLMQVATVIDPTTLFFEPKQAVHLI